MANNCTQENPCSCIGTNIPSTPVCTTSQECCLIACRYVHNCTESLGPCGEVGAFNLSSLNHNITGCSEEVIYILESHDDLFENVTINTSGLLNWTTGDVSTINKYSTIKYRIKCNSNCNDCITLNSVGYIQIGVKDPCKDILCNSSQICDKCSGTCVTNVDLEITDGISPDLEITIT